MDGVFLLLLGVADFFACFGVGFDGVVAFLVADLGVSAAFAGVAAFFGVAFAGVVFFVDLGVFLPLFGVAAAFLADLGVAFAGVVFLADLLGVALAGVFLADLPGEVFCAGLDDFELESRAGVGAFFSGVLFCDFAGATSSSESESAGFAAARRGDRKFTTALKAALIGEAMV